MENQPQQPNVQIKIEDQTLKGAYANVMRVLHTPEEFVMDFMNVIELNGIVSARVIVAPGHFKRIVAALNDNLKKYEQVFGEIKAGEVNPQQSKFDSTNSKIGFQAE